MAEVDEERDALVEAELQAMAAEGQALIVRATDERSRELFVADANALISGDQVDPEALRDARKLLIGILRDGQAPGRLTSTEQALIESVLAWRIAHVSGPTRDRLAQPGVSFALALPGVSLQPAYSNRGGDRPVPIPTSAFSEFVETVGEVATVIDSEAGARTPVLLLPGADTGQTGAATVEFDPGEGPTATVSVSLHRGTIDAVRGRAGRRGFSQFVERAVQRELEAENLRAYVEAYEAEHGGFTADELARAEALLNGPVRDVPPSGGEE